MAQIGADPADDEDTRSSKGLLVLISLLILPISVLWGVLYLAFGSPVGYVPLLYFAILAGAIAVYSRTGNFAMSAPRELVDILLAPTLSMIPLGGFLLAGGVGFWGVLAPLGRWCSATFAWRSDGSWPGSSSSSVRGSWV